MTVPSTVPAIAFESATKCYATVKGANTTILESITSQIQRREFVSIIGPSGCGKSTLLRLVAGLSPIKSGDISIHGMTPQKARELISFIFQDATLLPWRTVRQNVVLGLELDGMARETRNAKVDAVLALVGLDHVADSFPRQLSGGMKMRVSIARALATRPQLLLLDEPFAALDEMSRDRINEELLRLHEEQNWTSLFVTHSVAEAVFLSTRILILAPNPGRIVQDIPINLPLPRNEATRRSEAFDRTIAEVSRALRAVNNANTSREITTARSTDETHRTEASQT
jgi:NitT/TauT family transport system ATP-binding protein